MKNSKNVVALAALLNAVLVEPLIAIANCMSSCLDEIMLRIDGQEPSPLTEITCDEDVYQAILDDCTLDVYAIYYYFAGNAAEDQKRTLALLNGHLGGTVKLLCVDVGTSTPPELIRNPHYLKEMSYVEIHRLCREPVTGNILSSDKERISAPIGFTALRLKLEKFLSMPKVTGNFACTGRAHVPGWDFETSAFVLRKEGRGQIEHVAVRTGLAHPTIVVKVDSESRWFAVDTYSCDDINAIKIGTQVSYGYNVYSDPRSVYSESVRFEELLRKSSDRPGKMVGVNWMSVLPEAR